MPIPQQRDPEETTRLLTGWIRGKIPGATDLAITNLSPPSATGFSNDTLLFDSTWREEGRERQQSFVARIKPSGYAIFPEYDLRQQFTVMHLLAAHSDVPVPRVFWFEEDTSILGAPFYLMGKIDGRIPGDNPPYHIGGWVTEISPEERRSLWLDGLEVMTRIHKLDWEDLGFGFLDQPRRGTRGLAQQISYYESYLAWAARGKPQPITERAFAWIKAHLPEQERISLCWGDSRIGNMIFRDGKCQAVLDWEMVCLGDGEQDLAWWLFLDRHHSEGMFSERLPGFPDRQETVARYEDLLQHRVHNLSFYEMWAGFRFAVIMMRIAQMMIAYDVLPPDSELETNNIVTQLLEKMLSGA